MRALIYLEPLWFRGTASLLRGHIDEFVLPFLSALQDENSTIEVCFCSNVILCLDFLNSLRSSELNIPHVSIRSIDSNTLLSDCDFRTDLYCADLFARFGNGVANARLRAKILDIFNACQPTIVATTSPNRHLREICETAQVPFVSMEYGPLPRVAYPSSRFISLNGHLSDGEFHSAKYLRAELDARGCKVKGRSHLDNFRSAFLAAVAKQDLNSQCQEILSQFEANKSVAMLSLQPTDWISWEGALQAASGPAPLILRALSVMRSDYLIVTFHPYPSDRVVGNQFVELWLADPRLIKLPEHLSVGTSEIFLPLVEEVLTVSSNVAMSAYLLGKRLTPLAKSYVNTLSELECEANEGEDVVGAVAEYLISNYTVPDKVFRSASALRHAIDCRVRAKFDVSLFDRPHCKPSDTILEKSDTLDEIHQKIRAFQEDCKSNDDAEFARMFGRHAIGYLVGKGAVGAELGVAAGVFSQSLLMSGNFETLYSVDSWSDHHDTREYHVVCDRLSQYGARSVVVRSTFDGALNQIPDNHLDFIYIDAYAHTGAASDILRTWISKLKDGAIIAGHDFCAANWSLNHGRLMEAFADLNLTDVATIPGVFTFNSEDIFPSFVVEYRSVSP